MKNILLQQELCLRQAAAEKADQLFCITLKEHKKKPKQKTIPQKKIKTSVKSREIHSKGWQHFFVLVEQNTIKGTN